MFTFKSKHVLVETWVKAIYCDVFPVKTSNNLQVADFMLDLLDISSGEICNYYSRNLTVITLH
jgi:hypothetical protein